MNLVIEEAIQNPSKFKFSVLIFDKEEHFASLLEQELKAHFANSRVKERCQDISDLKNKYKDHDPDLVFIDLRLITPDALKCIKDIWSMDSGARLIFSTQQQMDALLPQIYRYKPATGAYAWIEKDMLLRKLNDVIPTVLYGRDNVETKVGQLLSEPELSDIMPPAPLYDLLLYFALGVKDQAISQMVCVSLSTVRAKELELYTWLGIKPENEFNPRRRAIWLAYERGLLSDTILSIHESRLKQLLQKRELV